MSMIEKQIEQLERVRDKFFNWKTWEWNVIDSAIDTIETLSAKVHDESMERSSRYCNGGWIPCSERTPEDGRIVIAQWRYIDRSGYDWQQVDYMELLRVVDDKWVDNSGHRIKGKCLAWQPLPEPYEEADDV